MVSCPPPHEEDKQSREAGNWFQAILPQSPGYYPCPVWSTAQDTQKDQQMKQRHLSTRVGHLEGYFLSCQKYPQPPLGWQGRSINSPLSHTHVHTRFTSRLHAAQAACIHKHWCEHGPHRHVSSHIYPETVPLPPQSQATWLCVSRDAELSTARCVQMCIQLALSHQLGRAPFSYPSLVTDP